MQVPVRVLFFFSFLGGYVIDIVSWRKVSAVRVYDHKVGCRKDNWNNSLLLLEGDTEFFC